MIRNSNAMNCFILTKKLAIQLFGEDRVYDTTLPPKDTPYPFVYIANQSVLRYPTKGNEIEYVAQTVRFYHDDITQRGTLDSMIYALRLELDKSIRMNNSQIRLSDFNTIINPEELGDGLKLLHGTLQLTYIANDTIGG